MYELRRHSLRGIGPVLSLAVAGGAGLVSGCGSQNSSTSGDQTALSRAAVTIDTTAEYMLVNDASGLCLDDQSGSTRSASAVDQASCGANNNTLWQFHQMATGIYQIVNKTSGMCLAQSGKTTTFPLSQFSSGSLNCGEPTSNNLRWTVKDVGNGYVNVVSQTSGMCATNPSGSTTAGTVLQQMACVSGNTSMMWKLVGGSSSSAPNAGADAGARADAGSSSGGPLVWTNRYDVGRSGSQTAETLLTPATVSGGKFGRLFSLTVDGTIQAQPLYAPNVTIGGTVHDVVFVATEHDSVYAFDADAVGPPLWSISLGMAVPYAGAPWTCRDLIPESGISATPVLDATTGTLYVLAETLEGDGYHRKLHALDWATGKEQTTINGTTVTSPVEIAPPQPEWTAPPANHFSRVGLLLDHGTIYSAYSSHCDQPGPWYGWVVANDALTLKMQGSFEGGKYGGIWQSGQGLTTDGNGGIYFVSGTGSAGGGGVCNATNLCQTVGRLHLDATQPD
jgi:hypothetical protein